MAVKTSNRPRTAPHGRPDAPCARHNFSSRAGHSDNEGGFKLHWHSERVPLSVALKPASSAQITMDAALRAVRGGAPRVAIEEADRALRADPTSAKARRQLARLKRHLREREREPEPDAAPAVRPSSEGPVWFARSDGRLTARRQRRPWLVPQEREAAMPARERRARCGWGGDFERRSGYPSAASATDGAHAGAAAQATLQRRTRKLEPGGMRMQHRRGATELRHAVHGACKDEPLAPERRCCVRGCPNYRAGRGWRGAGAGAGAGMNLDHRRCELHDAADTSEHATDAKLRRREDELRHKDDAVAYGDVNADLTEEGKGYVGVGRPDHDPRLGQRQCDHGAHVARTSPAAGDGGGDGIGVGAQGQGGRRFPSEAAVQAHVVRRLRQAEIARRRGREAEATWSSATDAAARAAQAADAARAAGRGGELGSARGSPADLRRLLGVGMRADEGSDAGRRARSKSTRAPSETGRAAAAAAAAAAAPFTGEELRTALHRAGGDLARAADDLRQAKSKAASSAARAAGEQRRRCLLLCDEVLDLDPCSAAALSKKGSCLAPSQELRDMARAQHAFEQAVQLGAAGAANKAMCEQAGWAGLQGRMYRAEIMAQAPTVQKDETVAWCKRDQLRYKKSRRA
eukprot:g6838.t1